MQQFRRSARPRKDQGLVDAAIEAGVNFIDTADAYGNFGAPRGSGPASLTDGVSRTPRTFRPKDPRALATPPLPWGQFSLQSDAFIPDRDVAGWACDGAATPVAASGL